MYVEPSVIVTALGRAGSPTTIGGSAEAAAAVSASVPKIAPTRAAVISMERRFLHAIGEFRLTGIAHRGRRVQVPQRSSFLADPRATNVPERVLRAIDRATIDHRGPDFAELALECIRLAKPVFQTKGPVIIWPASGSGGWEAALVNTLSPGDKVLMAETGQFAALWSKLATRMGLDVEVIPGDWRHGVDPDAIGERLARDSAHDIKAVAVVHNETSTGVTSRVADVRKAIDAAKHPALFFVDTVSSLGSLDYRHDEWKVDVTVGGSQKGLMLPPGLAFNAISDKAIAASKTSRLPRSYWSWDDMLESNHNGLVPVHAGDELAVRSARSAHDARKKKA